MASPSLQQHHNQSQSIILNGGRESRISLRVAKKAISPLGNTYGFTDLNNHLVNVIGGQPTPPPSTSTIATATSQSITGRSSGHSQRQHQHHDPNDDCLQTMLQMVPSVSYYFDIVGKLGEGTFSKVYRARYSTQYLTHLKQKHTTKSDDDTGGGDDDGGGGGGVDDCEQLEKQEFALKYVHPIVKPRRVAKELRFLRDLRGEANVVPVKACLYAHGHTVMVMPIIEHDKFLDYFQNLDIIEVREYMRNLLGALAHVHSHNIVHRDIKPSNFLYNRKHRKYALVDFGLSQTQDELNSSMRYCMESAKNKRYRNTCASTPYQLSHSNSTTVNNNSIIQQPRKAVTDLQTSKARRNLTQRFVLKNFSCTTTTTTESKVEEIKQEEQQQFLSVTPQKKRSFDDMKMDDKIITNNVQIVSNEKELKVMKEEETTTTTETIAANQYLSTATMNVNNQSMEQSIFIKTERSDLGLMSAPMRAAFEVANNGGGGGGGDAETSSVFITPPMLNVAFETVLTAGTTGKENDCVGGGAPSILVPATPAKIGLSGGIHRRTPLAAQNPNIQNIFKTPPTVRRRVFNLHPQQHNGDKVGVVDDNNQDFVTPTKISNINSSFFDDNGNNHRSCESPYKRFKSDAIKTPVKTSSTALANMFVPETPPKSVQKTLFSGGGCGDDIMMMEDINKTIERLQRNHPQMPSSYAEHHAYVLHKKQMEAANTTPTSGGGGAGGNVKSVTTTTTTTTIIPTVQQYQTPSRAKTSAITSKRPVKLVLSRTNKKFDGLPLPELSTVVVSNQRGGQQLGQSRINNNNKNHQSMDATSLASTTTTPAGGVGATAAVTTNATTSPCDCTLPKNHAIKCGKCSSLPELIVPRAGTPGFRAPEILLRCEHQDSKIDIWSAGVIFASLLSGRYPFFRSTDDMTCLAEIITLLGSRKLEKVSKLLEKMLICSQRVPAQSLGDVCSRLRQSCQPSSSSPKKRMIGNNFRAPNSAYDLLEKLLNPYPRERLSAAEALEHEFFTSPMPAEFLPNSTMEQDGDNDGDGDDDDCDDENAMNREDDVYDEELDEELDDSAQVVNNNNNNSEPNSDQEMRDSVDLDDDDDDDDDEDDCGDNSDCFN